MLSRAIRVVGSRGARRRQRRRLSVFFDALDRTLTRQVPGDAVGRARHRCRRRQRHDHRHDVAGMRMDRLQPGKLDLLAVAGLGAGQRPGGVQRRSQSAARRSRGRGRRQRCPHSTAPGRSDLSVHDFLDQPGVLGPGRHRHRTGQRHPGLFVGGQQPRPVDHDRLGREW